MLFQTQLTQVAEKEGFALSAKGDKIILTKTLAERSVLFTKKKLVYRITYRIDEDTKTFHYSDSLSETGFGAFAGGIEMTSGVGIRVEKTHVKGSGERDSDILEKTP